MMPALAWAPPPPIEKLVLESTDIFKGKVISVNEIREECDFYKDRKPAELLVPVPANYSKINERVEVVFEIETTFKGIREGQYIFKGGFPCGKYGGATRVTGLSGGPLWPDFKKDQKFYVFARPHDDWLRQKFFFMDEWKSKAFEGRDLFEQMIFDINEADKAIHSVPPERLDAAYTGMAEVLRKYRDYDSLVLMYEDRLFKVYAGREQKALTAAVSACAAKYPAMMGAPKFLENDIEQYPDYLKRNAVMLRDYGAALVAQGNAAAALRPLCLAVHYAGDDAGRKSAQAELDGALVAVKSEPK